MSTSKAGACGTTTPASAVTAPVTTTCDPSRWRPAGRPAAPASPVGAPDPPCAASPRGWRGAEPRGPRGPGAERRCRGPGEPPSIHGAAAAPSAVQRPALSAS